jgi:hypothetical protein
MMIELFKSVNCRFSPTSDGWSSFDLNGYYPIKCHWIDVDSHSLVSCLLDFTAILPGKYVSTRMADHLRETLKLFGISDKVHAVVTDSGADAVAATALLSDSLNQQHYRDVLEKSHCCR